MSKTVVITGASRGIGAATARTLAGRGYNICVNYRERGAAADSVIAELEGLGVRACAIQADVSDEKSVERLFDQAEETLGSLCALVNNAAMLLPQCRLENITSQRINQLFQVNVTSSFLCCREAVRRLSTKHGARGGAIVNVSSAASRLGSPNEYVDYAATKGAIDTLTIGLAQEVAEEGIRVNAVRPGFIDTEMHADGGEPDRLQRVKQGIPLKRGGQPEEVAAAIAFLLSDEASYITGSFIDAAGGR